MKKSLLILMLFLAFTFQNTSAQFAVKFNSGMSFSKPGDDLGEAAVKGKAMQLFAEGELSYHQNFSKNTKFGVRGAVVLGQDYANFLSKDRLVEMKTSVTSYKARIYPISFSGRNEDGLEKALPNINNAFIEYITWIGVYSVFNSLHFDYGSSSATILETPYVDTYIFPDRTTKRTMKYVGWGVQPIIFQSDSDKWTCYAVFDFGKYSWKNAGGGMSSFKSNHVGFGVQYIF